MKISEKVIRFAEGEMSTREKKEFEKELENSPVLKEQLNSYKNILLKTEEIKYIPVEENYFTSVIPNFRIRQSKKTGLPLYTKAAIGSSLAAFIIIFFIVLNSGNNEPVTGDVLVDYKTEEIDSMLNYYPQNYNDLDSVISNNENYSAIVDSMLYTELDVSEDNIELISVYLPGSDYSQSYGNNISDEEADVIYNEILKKNFF